METVDKAKLLGWLYEQANKTDSWVEKVLLENLVAEKVKSGAFDAGGLNHG